MIEIVFSCLAAALHVYFFCLESLLWGRPRTNKIFGITQADAETTRMFAFNQGFYNLFLAIGVGAGLVCDYPSVKIFALACMLGAAVVLVSRAPHLYRGALLQGLAPALALAASSV